MNFRRFSFIKGKFNYKSSIYLFCCVSSLSNVYEIKTQNLNRATFRIVTSNLLLALEIITSMSSNGKDVFPEENSENLILVTKYIKKFKYLYLCCLRYVNFFDLGPSNDKELNIIAIEMLFLLNGI